MSLSQEESKTLYTEEDQSLLAKWTNDIEEFTWQDDEDRYTSYVYFQKIKQWFAAWDKTSQHYTRTVQEVKYLGMFGDYAIWRAKVHHKDIKREEGKLNLSFTDYVYLYQHNGGWDDQFDFLEHEEKDVRQIPDLEKVKKYTELWKDE